jgi:alkylation response protein AidB-like acyl-CoA dehydrogenase
VIGYRSVAIAEVVERGTEDDLRAFRDRVDQVLGWSVEKRRSDTDSADVMQDARRLQRALADAGLAGLTYPKEIGGAGLTEEHQRAFDDVAERHEIDPVPLLVTLGMCVPTLVHWGSDDQQRRYVPQMLSGSEVWCQLFSEPSAGSDLGGLRTSARPAGDCWVLDGQKVWCSFAQLSDFGLCIARTDPSVPKHGGLSAFIVDMRAPGIDVRPIRQITGASEFNEVFFAEVVLKQDALLGRPGDGWKVALSVLGFERMQIAARMRPLLAGHADRAVGIARTAQLSKSPEVRQALVDLVISERILGWIANRVGADLADGRVPGAESSILKLGISQLASRAASLAMRLAGASSIAWEGDEGMLAHAVLDATKLSIAGGTSEVQRNIAAERLLGLPREPAPDRTAAFNSLSGWIR